ncbi:hypothetical protein ABZX95_08660 [Streptomyces sp. NPDC004232]|uniref:hypothetical protein n=1 Tax=Streptomyces sp. NPDC004232 TaxID=3154454 RepID=UPI0033A939A2
MSGIAPTSDHPPPWELAIPFALAILLTTLNALSLSLMTRNAIATLRREVGVGKKVPRALIPEQLVPFVTWVSDASQAIVVIFAPFFGVATVTQYSQLAWLLSAAALVGGFSLFWFVYRYKTPMDYNSYAQDAMSWLTSSRTKRRKLVRIVTYPIFHCSHKLGITLVTLVSLTLNFVLMAAALAIGYT